MIGRCGIALLMLFAGCKRDAVARQLTVRGDTSSTHPATYTGNDRRGIPRYARLALSVKDRQLLRNVYGIENPDRLYISDSTDDHLLKYDTKVKRCARCYVNSYRIGFVSIRRPGESWDALERRVHRMRRRDFPADALVATTSIAALDPDIIAIVERMLADAHAAGFNLRVVETYRSPEREAYLMSLGGSRTHTLTSLHSYGRAIDIAVDDGNPAHARTRADWIVFRRWLIAYHHQEFRLVGSPERTWDWPHVKIPSASIGFASVDAAIARAKRCSATGSGGQPPAGAASACNFQPHLPISSRAKGARRG